MWNKFPNTPPDIPETEDFGIDYEVKYKLPNGKIETTITEWLWEKNGIVFIQLLHGENILLLFHLDIETIIYCYGGETQMD